MSEINCEYFKNKTCNVCRSITLPYNEQLQLKINKVQGYFPNFTITATESSPFSCRDKVKFQVSGSYENPIIGFLDPKDLIVQNEILSCPLHKEKINAVIHKLPNIITKYKLQPYDVKTQKGELKGIILFHSPTTNEMYLRFVLRSKESLDRLQKVVSDFPEIHSISANLQPTPHAILEGVEEIYFKDNKITHAFNGLKLFLSPQGFVQTNTQVAEKLYATASLWAKEVSPSKIADLYCGHGPFSFHLENDSTQVLGIEVNKEAIAFANESKKAFGYQSTFIASPAENIQKEINEFNPDLIVVNPPRAGLKKFVHTLLQEAPAFILYSSCNLETLKQDYEVLKDKYTVEKMQVFDMFPQSEHMEVLMLLKRI